MATLKSLLKEKYLASEEQTKKFTTEEKRKFMEAVASFHNYGESIYANGNVNEMLKEISTIVEIAEQLTLQETEHWFDNVSVSRHMKQLKEAYKVFEKTAQEMSGLQQRLESAYDDMGTVLSKYYNVGNSLNTDLNTGMKE